MAETPDSPTRRSVLKQAATLSAAVVGSASVVSARESQGAVGGVLKRDVANPIDSGDRHALVRQVNKQFRRQTGRTPNTQPHPVTATGQKMVAYAVRVTEDGTARQYQGFVPSSDVQSSQAVQQSETVQRHRTAESFAQQETTTSSGVTAQGTDVSGFNDFAYIQNEFGDCEGGKAVVVSELFNDDENTAVWGMRSTTQTIPGVRTECSNSYGLSEQGTAEHRYTASAATDPLIISRTPTGTEDGDTTISGSFSISVGTDTSGSGTIGGSYTMPDVYFSSTGSTERTQLNWSYNSSSSDVTWQRQYASICDMREVLQYRDLIAEDYYQCKFSNGPDAELAQLFQNVPGGGV